MAQKLSTAGDIRSFFESLECPQTEKLRRPSRKKMPSTDDASNTTPILVPETKTSPYFAGPVSQPVHVSKLVSAALNAGFKQTRLMSVNASDTTDVSDASDAFDCALESEAVPVKFENPWAKLTAHQWMTNMSDIMRFELYLGNIPELVKFANEKHPNGMCTRQVRGWLMRKENQRFIPSYLEDTNFAVDHIVSASIGGIDHPYNFFLLPRVLNNAFSGWATIEKKRLVGKEAWGQALDLQRWYSLKAKTKVDLSQFDPVSDHYMVQRSK
jgi:hypothetical protein